jgi:hypothetical protein
MPKEQRSIQSFFGGVRLSISYSVLTCVQKSVVKDTWSTVTDLNVSLDDTDMPDFNSPATNSDSSDSDSSDSDSSEHAIVDPPTFRLSNKRDRTTAEQDYYAPIKGFRTEPPETHAKRTKHSEQSGKRYVFKESYLTKWKWLAYNTERKVAYCSFAGCSMYDPFQVQSGFVNQ